MSVVIRMQRAGGRNYPFFRVVVADSRRARDGRFLEKLGFYNPLSHPAQVQLDQERTRFWIERGAKPSESVAVLLKKATAAGPIPAVRAAEPVSPKLPEPVIPREQPREEPVAPPIVVEESAIPSRDEAEA